MNYRFWSTQQSINDATRDKRWFGALLLLNLGLISLALLVSLRTSELLQTGPDYVAVAVTEDAEEAQVQNGLRDWFVALDSVDEITSFDVDMPEGEAPLVYIEVVVPPGYNNASIPDAIISKLNEELGTTTYSNFTVIVDDGERVVEYILEVDNATWFENELSYTPPPEHKH